MIQHRDAKIIGIVGPIAAGKDLAASYISAKHDIPAFQTANLKVFPQLARLSLGLDANPPRNLEKHGWRK
jgi:hypothetical protein